MTWTTYMSMHKTGALFWTHPRTSSSQASYSLDVVTTKNKKETGGEFLSVKEAMKQEKEVTREVALSTTSAAT